MAIHAKDLATKLNVDAKTFRRYVRSQAKGNASIVSACGSGKRYDFSASEAKRLIAGYAEWAQSGGGQRSQPVRSLDEIDALLADNVDNESEA